MAAGTTRFILPDLPSKHRRLQDFTASRARVWLKVGVVKKVGVVMTTPTCNALESKPVKASISENIQLKKGSELLNKELSCHCCIQEKEIQYLIDLFLYRVSVSR